MNQEDTKDFDVEQYTQEERDVLAHMLMRSLRGSWNAPRDRALMLSQLARAGLEDYDSEAILARIQAFMEGGDSDGRTFRTIYERGPSFPEQTDEKTVRRLIGELPYGDMTFYRGYVVKMFEEHS